MYVNQLGPNQTLIAIGADNFFYSYNTLVAAQVGGKFYRTSQKYSVTTSKHINKWLEGVKAIEVSQNELERMSDK